MRPLLLLPSALLFCMPFALRADVIERGTEIAVRTESPIRVSQWDRGRIYNARVARDVTARDGEVAIPRGATVELIVRRIGDNDLALDLESVTVNGRRYVVDNAAGPEFDARNGTGLVGAIVGALSGNDVAQGREVRIGADSVITYRLREPMRVVDWQDPGYSRDRYHYHRDNDWYR